MWKWLQRIGIVIGFLGLCWTLFQLRPDQDYLRQQQFKALFKELMPQVQAQYPDTPLKIDTLYWPDSLKSVLQTQFKKWEKENPVVASSTPPLVLSLKWSNTRWNDRLAMDIAGQQFAAERVRVSWTSALPPLLAVTLALLTQRLVLSLFLAIACGSLLAVPGQPLVGVLNVAKVHGFHAVADFFHIQILLFAGLLLGMVGIMNVSGGTRGVIYALQRFVSTRRSTQVVTWIMGMFVFFDDYANSFVIGTTMRSVTDRLKISREKLAYLVDSTAAPVSGLAIISTWIGYEVGLFQEALNAIEGVQLGGYQAFVQALPYRFYCILTLLMVGLVVILKRDFGPMYHAEVRALKEGLILREGATPLTSSSFDGLDAKEGVPLRWINAAIPVFTVIIATLVGLFISGGGLNYTLSQWLNIQTLGTIFSGADSGIVLLYSSLSGCVVAAILVLVQRVLSPQELLVAWSKGVSSIGLAAVILVLAWMLNDVSGSIGTASFLIAVIRDAVQPLWLPLFIFLLAGAVAFSTGSSWSTMAILIPVAVPLAHELGGPLLMIIAMGAVLDGAIFGDHCSPLSDTTILSSMACSSDHLDHVKTQMPYALITMLVAAVLCYLPASAGWSPYPLIVLGTLALGLFLVVVGKNPEDSVPASALTLGSHYQGINHLNPPVVPAFDSQENV
jgi:Na+/H+ antiporter NhaC